MNKQDIPKFRSQLIKWYTENQRRLPWRQTDNPYHIWISEVMLQQTQVDTVIPYYHRFIRQFPDLPSLARADQQQVLKAWEGLGYYARARNLQKAARIVAAQHAAVIPDDIISLRKLPGVGDYISAAVLSIAFDQPLAVVDGACGW
jgi:A/G-specific adenine glycosylase